MARRLPNLLSTLSLLLCAAALGLWAASHVAPGTVSARVGADRWSIHSAAGALAIGHCGGVGGGDADAQWQWDTAAGRAAGVWVALGFDAGDVEVTRPVPMLSALPALGRLFSAATPGRFVRVPWAAVAAATAAWPALGAWRTLRRRARRRAGLCLACGYDLRATPGRCPECGHTP